MGTGNPWWLYNVLTASHFAKSSGQSAKKRGKKEITETMGIKERDMFLWE